MCTFIRMHLEYIPVLGISHNTPLKSLDVHDHDWADYVIPHSDVRAKTSLKKEMQTRVPRRNKTYKTGTKQVEETAISQL